MINDQPAHIYHVRAQRRAVLAASHGSHTYAPAAQLNKRTYVYSVQESATPPGISIELLAGSFLVVHSLSLSITTPQAIYQSASMSFRGVPREKGATKCHH